MNKKIKLLLSTIIITTFIITPTLVKATYIATSNNNEGNTNGIQPPPEGNFDPSQGGGQIGDWQPGGQGGPEGNHAGMGPGGPGNPGEMSGGSHGSEKIVESPNNTIPEDYQINSETQADSSEGLYSRLFDTEKVQEVNINISKDNFNYMLQNANEKPSVLADSFSIGDETIDNVGIKTKGNLTLKSVWSSDSDRFSFEINTSKFIKKKTYGENQNLYGIEKICLNNIYGDPTLMKEYLSYELMTKMGVPTPYYSLIKLNINGEFYGIYTMVESLDSSIINRTTGNSDGDLYKCEVPGGSLLYNYDTLDSLLNNDGTYKFDISTYTDKSNPLSSYTGILENKVYGTTIDDCEGKEDEVYSDANELFTWMKKLNELNSSENPNSESYKAEVESILDVDEVLRYFATNTYLVNLDHYQSQQQQNYTIYLVNGKVTVLPWDYNYSFGAFGVSGASGMINFSIDNPVSGTTLKERPLLNVLLQNDDYRAKYESYLADCTRITSTGGTVDGVNYEENHMSNEISTYEELLENASKNDPTAFYTYDEFIVAANDLKTLNNQRAKAVINQINDDFTTVSDEGVLSSSLGGMVAGGHGGPGGPGGMPPDGFNPNGEGEQGQPNTPTDENNQVDLPEQGNSEETSNKDKVENQDNETEEDNIDKEEVLDEVSSESIEDDNWEIEDTSTIETSDNNSIYAYIRLLTLSIVGMLFIIKNKIRKYI